MYDKYLADGFVPEQEAKAMRLVPESWAPEHADPLGVFNQRRRSRRRWLMGLVLLLIAAAGWWAL